MHEEQCATLEVLFKMEPVPMNSVLSYLASQTKDPRHILFHFNQKMILYWTLGNPAGKLEAFFTSLHVLHVQDSQWSAHWFFSHFTLLIQWMRTYGDQYSSATTTFQSDKLARHANNIIIFSVHALSKLSDAHVCEQFWIPVFLTFVLKCHKCEWAISSIHILDLVQALLHTFCHNARYTFKLSRFVFKYLKYIHRTTLKHMFVTLLPLLPVDAPLPLPATSGSLGMFYALDDAPYVACTACYRILIHLRGAVTIHNMPLPDHVQSESSMRQLLILFGHQSDMLLFNFLNDTLSVHNHCLNQLCVHPTLVYYLFVEFVHFDPYVMLDWLIEGTPSFILYLLK